MEYVYGGLSGVCAGIFSNPLDVIKTRLQLQGELKARGEHVVYYRNTLHAVFVIARAEGLVSLQKGLAPALLFQAVLNGLRLGSVDLVNQYGWTANKSGKNSVLRTGLFSALFGCVGGFVGSPFYLIKVQLQSHAAKEIAVGHQHTHKGTFSSLLKIYKVEGLKGLWRGSMSSVPRLGVGSAVQLSSFAKVKELLENYKILTKEKSLWNSFVASMSCGVFVALFMTPFDVIQTRMYNQGVDKNGKGLLYSGIFDCFAKTVKSEGFFGLFKGIGPCYLRIGPHSLLTLTFWDSFKKLRDG